MDSYFNDTGFYVNSRSLIAIGFIFPILGSLAVTGRFFARHRSRSNVGWDDWLCLPALASVFGIGIMYIYGAFKYGIGHRLREGQSLSEVYADPSYSQKPGLHIEYAGNILCAFGTGMIRLSFLLFYRRVFRGRTFDITSWTVIVLVAAWTVASVIGFIAICGKDLGIVLAGIDVYQQKCHGMLPLQGAAAIIGFIFDFMILAMPFPWIWRLQMPTAKKLAVSYVFICGIFTVGASGARMVTGISSLKFEFGKLQNIMGLRTREDAIGATAIWLFWSFIEVGTGMLVCCLPSLKPLFGGEGPKQHLVTFKSYISRISKSSSKEKLSSSGSSVITTLPVTEEQGKESVITVSRSWEQHTTLSQV